MKIVKVDSDTVLVEHSDGRIEKISKSFFSEDVKEGDIFESVNNNTSVENKSTYESYKESRSSGGYLFIFWVILIAGSIISIELFEDNEQLIILSIAYVFLADLMYLAIYSICHRLDVLIDVTKENGEQKEKKN